ncbi:MAG: hypothetical protein ABI597_10890 [Gammaproteobacteria bacterium]
MQNSREHKENIQNSSVISTASSSKTSDSMLKKNRLTSFRLRERDAFLYLTTFLSDSDLILLSTRISKKITDDLYDFNSLWLSRLTQFGIPQEVIHKIPLKRDFYFRLIELFIYDYNLFCQLRDDYLSRNHYFKFIYDEQVPENITSADKYWLLQNATKFNNYTLVQNILRQNVATDMQADALYQLSLHGGRKTRSIYADGKLSVIFETKRVSNNIYHVLEQVRCLMLTLPNNISSSTIEDNEKSIWKEIVKNVSSILPTDWGYKYVGGVSYPSNDERSTILESVENRSFLDNDFFMTFLREKAIDHQHVKLIWLLLKYLVATLSSDTLVKTIKTPQLYNIFQPVLDATFTDNEKLHHALMLGNDVLARKITKEFLQNSASVMTFETVKMLARYFPLDSLPQYIHKAQIKQQDQLISIFAEAAKRILIYGDFENFPQLLANINLYAQRSSHFIFSIYNILFAEFGSIHLRPLIESPLTAQIKKSQMKTLNIDHLYSDRGTRLSIGWEFLKQLIQNFLIKFRKKRPAIDFVKDIANDWEADFLLWCLKNELLDEFQREVIIVNINDFSNENIISLVNAVEEQNVKPSGDSRANAKEAFQDLLHKKKLSVVQQIAAEHPGFLKDKEFLKWHFDWEIKSFCYESVKWMILGLGVKPDSTSIYWAFGKATGRADTAGKMIRLLIQNYDSDGRKFSIAEFNSILEQHMIPTPRGRHNHFKAKLDSLIAEGIYPNLQTATLMRTRLGAYSDHPGLKLIIDQWLEKYVAKDPAHSAPHELQQEAPLSVAQSSSASSSQDNNRYFFFNSSAAQPNSLQLSASSLAADLTGANAGISGYKN